MERLANHFKDTLVIELNTVQDLSGTIQGSITDLNTKLRNLALRNWLIDTSRNLPRKVTSSRSG